MRLDARTAEYVLQLVAIAKAAGRAQAGQDAVVPQGVQIIAPGTEATTAYAAVMHDLRREVATLTYTNPKLKEAL